MLFPLVGITKQFGGVYVANNVVDVFLIDDEFRVSAFDKLLSKLVDGAIVEVYRIDFGSRNHAIAHLGISKFQGVLKDFHLVVDVVFVLGTV